MLGLDLERSLDQPNKNWKDKLIEFRTLKQENEYEKW